VALGRNESVDKARLRHRRADGLVIPNDDLPPEQFIDFLSRAFSNSQTLMAPGTSFYVWHADNSRTEFISAAQAVGWRVREILIWNKSNFTLGRQDYQWKHEPCLYGWVDGAAHYWQGGRAQSTVLDYDRPRRNEEHPTMKPIALFDRLIRNSCPPDGVVYDPFGGSGTTLLACEQDGRTCWMVETDPRYCQVVINRWEKLTGRKAVKAHD
jgi:site-specific DNA-methyltransferase (adenine-specific)